MPKGGPRVGNAPKDCVTKLNELIALDLHWNYFAGSSVCGVTSGMWANKVLRRVDLS